MVVQNVEDYTGSPAGDVIHISVPSNAPNASTSYEGGVLESQRERRNAMVVGD